MSKVSFETDFVSWSICSTLSYGALSSHTSFEPLNDASQTWSYLARLKDLQEIMTIARGGVGRRSGWGEREMAAGRGEDIHSR